MPSTRARLVSLQVGLPRELGTPGSADPFDRPWTSGIFKLPVAGPVWLSRTGLAGDGQADLRVHGGPEKAVHAYAAAHYPAWRADLALPGLAFGAFGENFTLEGLDEGEACIGDVWGAGEALLQVSQPRGPCWKLSHRWRMPDLPARVVRTGRTGWYFRVLREGALAAGSALTLVERPHPRLTVARANRAAYPPGDPEAAAELAACPLLAPGWREAFERRALRPATGAPRPAE